jgi:transposase
MLKGCEKIQPPQARGNRVRWNHPFIQTEEPMPETLFPLPEAIDQPPEIGRGKPRLETGDRQQIAMRYAALDDLLPEDHRARLVWAMVQSYDLSRFYTRIEALEGEAGRPAIDPRLLTAVWLYATLEGVVSARALARLCEEHLAYQWLLGGVRVNYHTLADFRVDYETELDDLLSKSVAALMSEGVVSIERTAQDGMRIRASAGASSFRRKPTLDECLRKAQTAVEEQKVIMEVGESDQRTRREQAAQQRHVRERLERVKKALEEVEKVAAKQAKNRESRRKKRPPRASTSDPEARVMKMADGGFRPAYNGQLAIDMDSRIIVGVEVSNEADQRLLDPMLEQIEERFEQFPQEHYVDGGFRSNPGIEQAVQKGIAVFSPIPTRYSGNSQKRPEEILPTDGPGVRAWKERMQTEAAQEKYKQRAATVEWANALARNRGLYRLLVRGIRKARAVLLWYALAHNLLQSMNLRLKSQAQAI